MVDYSYSSLYQYPKLFELMENSANALLLQFKTPIKFDLTIPRSNNIERLLHIFQEGFNGETIDPSQVDCCYPVFDNQPLLLNFEGKSPGRIGFGLGYCFNKNKQGDHPAIREHLEVRNDIFGKEDNLYRFREGMREKIQKEVEEYFTLNEIITFQEIGNYIQPYIKNLDESHICR